MLVNNKKESSTHHTLYCTRCPWRECIYAATTIQTGSNVMLSAKNELTINIFMTEILVARCMHQYVIVQGAPCKVENGSVFFLSSFFEAGYQRELSLEVKWTVMFSLLHRKEQINRLRCFHCDDLWLCWIDALLLQRGSCQLSLLVLQLWLMAAKLYSSSLMKAHMTRKWAVLHVRVCMDTGLQQQLSIEMVH